MVRSLFVIKKGRDLDRPPYLCGGEEHVAAPHQLPAIQGSASDSALAQRCNCYIPMLFFFILFPAVGIAGEIKGC